MPTLTCWNTSRTSLFDLRLQHSHFGQRHRIGRVSWKDIARGAKCQELSWRADWISDIGDIGYDCWFQNYMLHDTVNILKHHETYSSIINLTHNSAHAASQTCQKQRECPEKKRKQWKPQKQIKRHLNDIRKMALLWWWQVGLSQLDPSTESLEFFPNQHLSIEKWCNIANIAGSLMHDPSSDWVQSPRMDCASTTLWDVCCRHSGRFVEVWGQGARDEAFFKNNNQKDPNSRRMDPWMF